MQNRQCSALMMSNTHFLFVALPYINIKLLRVGRGGCVWCATVNGHINVSSRAPRKSIIGLLSWVILACLSYCYIQVSVITGSLVLYKGFNLWGSLGCKYLCCIQLHNKIDHYYVPQRTTAWCVQHMLADALTTTEWPWTLQTWFLFWGHNYIQKDEGANYWQPLTSLVLKKAPRIHLWMSANSTSHK